MNGDSGLTEQPTDGHPIRYVLFVCNHNAGRSQIAQALFERYGPEEVRAIRDLVAVHVDELVIERLAAIYADRTAHQMRLARLLPMLATEFAATRSPEAIRGCADAVLDRFDGARVRSHIMTLAHRQTRECLRQEHCDALQVD